ncbi:juvenile hormone esterase [Drosophila willistoni]|uniref:juvenile hormone esterase n=1 Tax=Drosophila willistoni TaxID=7260 RepID=UPI000C26C146|nr:juvenile hormone esterase [Drosophila willistoni]
MLKSHLPLVYLYLYLGFISAENDYDFMTICPRVGCMKGRYMNGFQTSEFEAYMGIPYAEPPLGHLRFRNPVWKPRWHHVLDATKPKPDCIQKDYFLPNAIVYGEEDCLYLNIYRPVLRAGLLPVMLYIHGGGFFSGSASPSIIGPEYIMDTGEVILVTMAYRLGPLGFLSTGDWNMPGNFGLKDQHMVLKWIRNNIESFDGDRTKVTIFGHNAGAVATHMHLLNPNSANLFQRVISMSGTANVPFAITKEPLKQARRMGELCGVPNAKYINTADLASSLREVDASQIVNAGDSFKCWDVDPLTIFRPVVEPPGPDSIIPDTIDKLMKSIHYQRRPWLLGFVPDEGAVRAVNLIENVTLLNQFNSDFACLFEELMEWPESFTEEEKKQKTGVLVTEYFKNDWGIKQSNKQGIVDSISDRGFKHPLYKTVKDHHTSKGRNWFYQYLFKFSYKGPFSYASLYTQSNVTGKYGVVHGDELLYLFRSPLLFPDFDKKSTEAKVIDLFVTYIVNFARFGYVVDAPRINLCSAKILAYRDDGICDYHEFTNSYFEGFTLIINYRFPTDKVRLWQELLEEKV